MFCVIKVNYSCCWAEKKVKSSKNRFLKTGFQDCVSLVCTPYIHVIQLTYIYAQIPRNGLTLGSCLQQWGSHYYIIKKKVKLMLYILLYGRSTSWNNFVYQKTLIYNIYPRIMTKVNVSATVGMSATVWEMSATVGECPRQWRKLNML